MTKEAIERNWEKILSWINEKKGEAQTSLNLYLKPFKVCTVSKDRITFIWDSNRIDEEGAIRIAQKRLYELFIQEALYDIEKKYYDISFIKKRDIENEIKKAKKESSVQQSENDREDEYLAKYEKMLENIEKIKEYLFEEDKDTKLEILDILSELKQQLDILSKVFSGNISEIEYISMIQSIRKVREKKDIMEKMIESLENYY